MKMIIRSKSRMTPAKDCRGKGLPNRQERQALEVMARIVCQWVRFPLCSIRKVFPGRESCWFMEVLTMFLVKGFVTSLNQCNVASRFPASKHFSYRLAFNYLNIRENKNMLVLSRKIEQSIQIGDDVWITIKNIDRNSVSLGITAPNDVRVMRTEVLQRDQRRETQQRWTDEKQ